MDYRAGDVMNTDVVAVSHSMDLRELAKLFLEKSITGAPVVDDDGNLEGVISQTDLIYYGLTRDDELRMESDFYQRARVEGAHVPQGFQIEDTNSGCVADVMTPVVHSVTANASLNSVARLMVREHIHRVIVRRGRKVAGVISALDVLGAQPRSGGSNGTKSGQKTPTRKASAKGALKGKPAARKKPAQKKAAAKKTAKKKAAKRGARKTARTAGRKRATARRR